MKKRSKRKTKRAEKILDRIAEIGEPKLTDEEIAHTIRENLSSEIAKSIDHMMIFGESYLDVTRDKKNRLVRVKALDKPPGRRVRSQRTRHRARGGKAGS